jgi:hypothetical protein
MDGSVFDEALAAAGKIVHEGELACPEHSPLGASSAERWMRCPGSVALKQALGSGADIESEYAAEGTLAHALGAHCLNNGLDCWEAMAEFPTVTSEMADAVQSYLDYARDLCSFTAPSLVEHRVANPAFHKDMFGTLDFATLEPSRVEFVDYKHGVGVAVDVEENVQLRYYAFALISGETWPADLPRISDMAKIKLTIVQPRGFHPEGPIRSWVVTAGEIRNWAYNELHGAMKRAGEHTFSLGEHCRFCPAKLVCPAMRHLGADAALAQHEAATLPDAGDEWLGAWYGRLSQLKMFIKAIEGETSKRALAGKTIPGVKLVYGRVDRVWKPEAPLETVFGTAAWEPAKLRSPAQIEALPGGKDFCAEYAEKPKAGLTVAPESDRRTAQKALTNEEVFAGVEIPA